VYVPLLKKEGFVCPCCSRKGLCTLAEEGFVYLAIEEGFVYPCCGRKGLCALALEGMWALAVEGRVCAMCTLDVHEE
jgi:hypothetical protein